MKCFRTSRRTERSQTGVPRSHHVYMLRRSPHRNRESDYWFELPCGEDSKEETIVSVDAEEEGY